MYRYSLFLLLLSFSILANAADGNYAVATIPEALLKNAHVVKRMEETRFEIISTGETVLYQKYAVTILNENGNRHAQFVQGYDKVMSIRSIDGALYDAEGKLLRKLKSKDIQDVSGVSNGSLIDDSRIKAHSFYHNSYPYTVEYEFEQKFNHTLTLPAWRPQEDENIAVEKSRFTLIHPINYKVRYKALNYKGESATKTLSGKNKIDWEVTNIPAVVRPFASPFWDELTTVIYLAPSEFEVEGYKGVMDTWTSFGKFQLALNQGRDKLPNDIAQKVQQLTSGVQDDHEKVKILYRFLQQNTRYISVQLGVGGWQPFDAAYVAKNGYGDCKALSNYMYSLLKAAGIKSYYTLVRAGEKKEDKRFMEDFPSRQSNHIILCVPFSKDTIWLECTDQYLPAGYVSGFTANRKALAITEEGGIVVSTPKYQINENAQIRSIVGKLDQNGNLEVNVRTSYSGIQQDDVFARVNQLSKDELRKSLNEQLDLATYNVNDFKYEQKTAGTPIIEEQLSIAIVGQATISGKRLFVTPNLLNRSNTRVPEVDRSHDFVFDFEYRDVDSVEIEVPEGYSLEATPADVSLKTKFGTYSSRVLLSGNKLYYLRVREQYAGRYPAKDKDELTNFLDTIYKADKSRVVLVKKSD